MMSDGAGIVLLVGRILFAVFFLYSASGHIRQSQMMVGYAKSKAFPLAAFAGWPAGLYLLVASVSIILGIWPDLGALLLALWTIPTALYFHNYWAAKDPQQKQMDQMSFLRNVTYLGGAIALFAVSASAGDGLRFAVTAPLIQF